MEKKVQCPWCNQEVTPAKKIEKGSHGDLRMMRCSLCKGILSVRLEGEPDDILIKLPKKGE
jgi:predicted SprT family Zn-dependent metalloprotease